MSRFMADCPHCGELFDDEDDWVDHVSCCDEQDGPEVVAWMWRDINGDVQFNYMHPNGEPLIRLTDHERLQAETERLQADHEEATRKEAEAASHWRKLAHQFDRQRMDAMAMLKLVAASQALAEDCATFVAAAPECGDSVIAAHEAARAADKARIKLLEADAARYRWLRDHSQSFHTFYLSVPIWMAGVSVNQEKVDRSIDAAIVLSQQGNEGGA